MMTHRRDTINESRESGRPWVKVDGFLTESGRSFRKWTVLRRKVDVRGRIELISLYVGLSVLPD